MSGIKCNFEFAICALKNGKSVYREGEQKRVILSKNSILMRENEDGQFIPWLPSNSDILADDWIIEKKSNND